MRLWDLYGGLLTGTQRELSDMYFNKDLTVSEIAEEKGVSRQAVSECVAECKKRLCGFEKKLGFFEKSQKEELETSLRLADAARWAKRFILSHPAFAGEIGELEDILGRDYSAEAARELSPKPSALGTPQEDD